MRAMGAADTLPDVAAAKRCTECGARFGADAAFCPFDGSALQKASWSRSGDPRTRRLVDGRYEVLEPIGEGGMGTVYRVRHTTLNRFFAMKVLRHDLAGDAELGARFLREARATAAIKHPYVVSISDFGELEEAGVRTPWFVMELLEGETLASRIRTRGPVAPALALRIGRRIADGLAAAHEANVIHRDLKPENVFLVGEGVGKSAEEEIRVVDFGAAKIIGESKMTRPGIVFGTPYYMAPEQASGQAVDARTDVYALGIVLYEMVTGRVPFDADTYMGVLTKHLYEAPPRPGVETGALEAIILRALEKDPRDRFASMGAVAQALAEAETMPISEARARASRQRAKLAELPSSRTMTERIGETVERHEASERARRTIGALLIGTSAIAAFLIALFVASRREATSIPPPSVPSITASATAAPEIPVAKATPPPEAVESAIPSERPIRPAPPPIPRAHVVAPAITTSASPMPSVRKPQPLPTVEASPRIEDFRDPWAPK
jgi:eukaryotic-like serine/threonine-protein kinase